MIPVIAPAATMLAAHCIPRSTNTTLNGAFRSIWEYGTCCGAGAEVRE